MFRNADLEPIVMPADRVVDGCVERAFVNKGFYYLDLLDGENVPFMNDHGQNYCGLLDEDGSPLKPGNPVVFLWFKLDDLRNESRND